MWSSGFEDSGHQAMKDSDPERREWMSVSPAFAPTCSLERVLRKQGREGGPSSPVKSLSGGDVTEVREPTAARVQTTEESTTWKESRGGLWRGPAAPSIPTPPAPGTRLKCSNKCTDVRNEPRAGELSRRISSKSLNAVPTPSHQKNIIVG